MIHERLAVHFKEPFTAQPDGDLLSGSAASMSFFMQLAQQPLYDRGMDLHSRFYHGTWRFLYDGIQIISCHYEDTEEEKEQRT